MVPKAGKFFGRPFGMERGVTHRDPVTPIIFNIVMDTVVREVLLDFFICRLRPHSGAQTNVVPD